MNLIKLLLRYRRYKEGFSVLPCIDEFRITASVRTISSEKDCERISERLHYVLEHPGLERHPKKLVSRKVSRRIEYQEVT